MGKALSLRANLSFSCHLTKPVRRGPPAPLLPPSGLPITDSASTLLYSCNYARSSYPVLRFRRSAFHNCQLLSPPTHFGCASATRSVFERAGSDAAPVSLCYVVMPEHFHLLVSEPRRGTVSTVIQALKLGFARRLLTPGCALRQPGTRSSPQRLWQARFYDFNIWTEAKRIEKVRYIHRNPVKRRLVASPEQWPWSSFRFYLTGEPGPVRINDTDILEMTLRQILA
jgi:REP element-mobilizing transposase RayT